MWDWDEKKFSCYVFFFFLLLNESIVRLIVFLYFTHFLFFSFRCLLWLSFEKHFKWFCFPNFTCFFEFFIIFFYDFSNCKIIFWWLFRLLIRSKKSWNFLFFCFSMKISLLQCIDRCWMQRVGRVSTKSVVGS